MDFRLSEPQQLLVATAREFLGRHCPLEVVQELADDERGFREATWKEIAMLGWPGLLVPADLGGSEGSMLDVTLLVEEMGRACFPGPFVPSAVVATSLLLAAGGPARRPEMVAAMATGDERCVLAVAEESVTVEPEAIALRGEAPGRLDGRKLFVKDAHVAHELVVLTRGGGGFNLVAMETTRPGLRLLPMETMAGEKLFEVSFAGVEARPEDLVGAPGTGWARLEDALRAGALARTAEMVGAARRILELCVDYAKVRVQGGRPIGSYQAIQHACADMLRDVETSRGLLYSAAWRMAAGRPCAPEVAMAKAHAASACLAVARRAHQILGAIGYCAEHPLHLLHKRIQAAALDCGDRSAHLETVARAIGLKLSDDR